MVRSASQQGRTLLVLLGAAMIAGGWGSSARGAMVTLVPSQDSTIYSDSDLVANAKGSLYAGEIVNGTGNVRRALLKFNFTSSGIPAGAIIDSVTVSLTQTKIGPAGAAMFELHPLLADWGEGTSAGTGAGVSATLGDSTWRYRFYDNDSWDTPGGNYGATSASTTFGTTNATYTFASQAGLVADVQSWINDPGLNFGWILRAANEANVPSAYSARELGSREVPGAQPTVTVTFTPAPEPGTWGLLGAGILVGLMRRFRRGPASAHRQ